MLLNVCVILSNNSSFLEKMKTSRDLLEFIIELCDGYKLEVDPENYLREKINAARLSDEEEFLAVEIFSGMAKFKSILRKISGSTIFLVDFYIIIRASVFFGREFLQKRSDKTGRDRLFMHFQRRSSRFDLSMACNSKTKPRNRLFGHFS